jgi:acetylornithine deacetylase/succinyl-diaminopimelate desuccinylase-like protein
MARSRDNRRDGARLDAGERRQRRSQAARAVTALQDFDFNFARHAVLGGPTLNVGTIKGGLNINSVPGRAAIGIDIRTIPGQSHAKIRDQLASSETMLRSVR